MTALLASAPPIGWPDVALWGVIGYTILGCVWIRSHRERKP